MKPNARTSLSGSIKCGFVARGTPFTRALEKLVFGFRRLLRQKGLADVIDLIRRRDELGFGLFIDFISFRIAIMQCTTIARIVGNGKSDELEMQSDLMRSSSNGLPEGFRVFYT